MTEFTHLKEELLKKFFFLYLPSKCLLKPENREGNFEKIYFDFFNLENYH